MKFCKLFFSALVWLSLACAAHAQILLGQTVGLTGPIAASAKDAATGAKLYFDSVNAKGGVHGEKIELITMDDKFDPKLTLENSTILIEQKKVLALFMNRGTPHTEIIMPLLAQYNVALLAPGSGAMVVRKPVNKQIFNIRASHQREAEKAIAQLKTVGVTRIVMVYVDDSFGTDILEGAQRGFAQEQLKPLAIIKADRAKPDLPAIVAEINKANPQSVIWVGSTAAVSDGIKTLRATGSVAQVLTFSNNASTGFIKLLGDSARGVIVSQVFPSERNSSYSMIREAQEIAKAAGQTDLSPIVLEGYAAAKVMVEALRRAGPKPTRGGIVKALDSFRKYDLGGLELTFTPDNHSGLDYVELSIIGADGKFKR
jgi:ABC-type branched-subunit amino acid transport system substrate-binding protein